MKFDQNISSGEFRHYATILVDLDFAPYFLDYLLNNRENGRITVDLVFKNILDFCNACSSVSHATAHWRRLEVSKPAKKVPTKSSKKPIDKSVK